MDPQERLQELHDEAQAIRARAERQRRDLTSDEVDRLDNIFAEFDRVQDRLDGRPSSRRTAPNPTNGPHHQNFHHIGSSVGERLVDRYGNEIRVLAQEDRFAEQIPRSDRLPFSDLAAIVYGAASGDFSRVSDRCRSIMAQQGGQTDAAGGVLIPTPLSAEVIDIIRDASVFMRSGARSIFMSSRTLDYGRVVEPPHPSWRAEHGVIPQTDVVLDRVTLEAKNLGCMVRSSIELLDDSPTASNLLRNLLATEMAAALDSAMLLGTGGLQPTGLVTMAISSPQLVQVIPDADCQDFSDWISALGMLWQVNTNPTAVLLSAKTKTALAMLDTGNPATAIRPPADLASLPSRHPKAQLPWFATSWLLGDWRLLYLRRWYQAAASYLCL